MNDDAADFDEARWRRLADADAAEEPLSSADRDFLDRFIPRSAPARAEAELFAAMARLGKDDWQDEEAANSPLVHATVQHVLAARRAGTPVAEEPAAPTPSRRRWTIPALAAAAAVLVASWLGLQAIDTGPEEPAASRIAAVDEPAQETAAPTAGPTELDSDAAPEPEPEPRVLVGSGRLLDAQDTPLVADAAVRGAVRVDSERGCVGVGEATACFQRGARLEIDEAEPTRITLEEGHGVIEAPVVGAGAVMIVEIAGERYTLATPVTIETTAYSRKSARVEVLEGRVTVVDADGSEHVLEAGAVRGRTKHAHVQPPPDPKTLLAKARASRSAGDRAAAISHYEKLLHHHPDLPASHAAMVSLGDLYLDTGKPDAALRWFQRYLDQGGGALAQEAYIGRIKALGALGREAQQQRAIEAFRTRYPSSRYADQLGQ